MVCRHFSVTMKPYKAVLLDLNGTLHIEHSAIPGAVNALAKLQHNTGIQTVFVSNTTKHSRNKLIKQCTDLGFNITTDTLYTSLTTTATLFRTQYAQYDRPYVLLEPDAAAEFYALSGLKQQQCSTDEYNCVIVGLSPSSFTYTTLNTAFRILQRSQQHKLIAIHTGRYHKVSDGLNLGPGAFVAALEYATGRRAELIGKPSSTFYHSVLQSLSVSAADAVMIGDDVQSDCIGAVKADIDSVLVRTGKYTHGDENKYDAKPTYTYDSVVQAIDAILDAHKHTTSKL